MTDKEKHNKYQREWRKKNKEKVKKIQAKCYENNKEKIKGIQKNWRDNNKEKILVMVNKWQESNKDKVKKYKKKYKIEERKTDKYKEKKKIWDYAYRHLRPSLIKKYGKCQVKDCGSKKKLELHHVKYTNNIEDVVLLCKVCHGKEHGRIIK